VNGNPAFDPATDTSLVYTNLCHRSAHAYPQLVRRDARVRAKSFTFGACSGARLPHLVASVPRVGDALTGTSGGQWGESAQLDRIAPSGSADGSVNLVTLSIGGNDFGFSEIVRACTYGLKAGNSFGACIDKIDSFRSIGATVLMNGATVHMDNSGNGGYTICRGTCSGPRYVRVPKFTDILTEIHRRAPNATIVVVGYPHLLPEHPTSKCTLGFSGLSHYWMPPENIDLIDDGEEYVDDMIQSLVLSAAYHGVPVRFADPRGVFNRHDACQVHDRHGQPQTHAWINGLLFDGIANPSPYSMHPNAAGQAAYAGLVAGCYANPQACGSDPYTSNLIVGDGGLPPGTAVAAPVRLEPAAALTLASPTGSAPHAAVVPPRVVLDLRRPSSGASVLTGWLTAGGPCSVQLLISLPGAAHRRPATLGRLVLRVTRPGASHVRVRLAGARWRGRRGTARRLLVTLRVTGMAGAVRTTTMTMTTR